MSEGHVRLEVRDARARITFDRPGARNAMTFAMYGELADICEQVRNLSAVRAITLQGVGNAFVAGTDISEFTAFSSGENGLAYERRVEKIVSTIEELPAPTIAIVDGPAMGGGLVIAAACDFRLVSDRSRFGVPIARTLGNCLSSRNIARLQRNFGLAVTRRMLLLGRTLDAEEALRCGFALETVSQTELDSRADALVAELAANAPLTIAASRESLRRLALCRFDDDDLVARVYASTDFSEGIRAFLAKRPPQWTDSPSPWREI